MLSNRLSHLSFSVDGYRLSEAAHFLLALYGSLEAHSGFISVKWGINKK